MGTDLQISSPSDRKRQALTWGGTSLLLGGSLGVYFLALDPISWTVAGTGAVLLVMSRLTRKPSPSLSSEDRRKETNRFIRKVRYLENVGDLGERTAQQLEQISDRYKKFQALLPQKFQPEEITFQRYHAAAEQTFLSVLDNLHQVATALNTVDNIKPTNEEQTRLRNHRVADAKELLHFNDQAITEMDRVSTALSDIQTMKGQAEVSLEAAMKDLRDLADRAKKYEMKTER